LHALNYPIFDRFDLEEGSLLTCLTP
jgi:hypothetical protein